MDTKEKNIFSQVLKSFSRANASAFREIEGILKVKKETSKTVEVVYFKDHKERIKKFCNEFNKKKLSSDNRILTFGQVGSNSTHEGFVIELKNKVIKVRSTGIDPFKQNRNSLGKKLADAGELATIVSLTESIVVPDDTKQKLFMEHPDAFEDWRLTFNETKKILKYPEININILNYDILHDSTDKSEFTKLTRDVVKKGKPFVTSKDSWCPADIWLVSKSGKSKIISEFREIVERHEGETLLGLVRQFFIRQYKERKVFPISLKQLIDTPKIELNNKEVDPKFKTYNIKIDKLNLDMSFNSKEVGVFQFKNLETDKQVKMQVRAFPDNFSTVQCEITHNGEATGGRLGKVPTNVIDAQFKKFGNYRRVQSISEFGKTKDSYFTNFNDSKIKEYYRIYSKVSRSKFIQTSEHLTLEEFRNLVDLSRTNAENASKLCAKLQGLRFLEFFIDNEKNTSEIMTNFINGAKKLSKYGCFFIRVF